MSLASRLEHADGLRKRKDVTGALAAYEAILQDEPDSAEAHSGLGASLAAVGRMDDAVRCFLRAVELDPGLNKAWLNLAEGYMRLGSSSEAEGAAREALAGASSDRGHAILGRALAAQDKLDLACSELERAVALNPQNMAAQQNLGVVLTKLGQPHASLACFDAVLAVRPDHVEVRRNRAESRRQLGDACGARDDLLEVVAKTPADAAALNNLGCVETDLADLAMAIAHLAKAVELEPDNPAPRSNLACALKDAGRLTEAREILAPALALAPTSRGTSAVLESNHLFMMHYTSDDPLELDEAHRRWANRWTQPRRRPVPNNPDPDRILRVAYLSSDLREHSVASFIEPLLEAHDRQRFDIVAYADVAQPDLITRRIGEIVRLENVHGDDDATLARRIEADGIDVLIELGGHTADSRLMVLARRPAPIQATYLGYPNTTGVPAIDLRFTDAIADPIGGFEPVEHLVRLSGGAWCFRAPTERVSTTRRSGDLVLGSFNVWPKVSPVTQKLWARALIALPDARLLLKTRSVRDAGVQRRAQEAFAALGVEPSRLSFVGWEPTRAAHLARYNDIDIALDTWPYGGTTTTCEALWMGVPVVTMQGRTHASRVGASLLHRVGLDDLVASDEDAFLTIVTALAKDHERRAALRETLRERALKSPLMNGRRLAEGIELALRDEWVRICTTARHRG